MHRYVYLYFLKREREREREGESLHCDPQELATLMEEDKELAERKLKAAVTGRSSTARRAPARGLLSIVESCCSTILGHPKDKGPRTKVRAVTAVAEYDMMTCFLIYERPSEFFAKLPMLRSLVLLAVHRQ